MQYQGESAVWSIMGTELQAAFSYIQLGGAAIQRILWVFVISLLLPWIFLFFDHGLPHNRQQENHADGLVQQHDHDEEIVERVPQAMEQEMGQPPERHFERDEDE
jgi:hypothetical protein